MLKKIFSYILSFLIAFATLHVDAHHKHYSDGYFLYNSEDEPSEQHYLSNHCEKCLVNKSKSTFKNYIESTFAFKAALFKPFNNRHIDYYLVAFSLFSRPPPKLIS